MSLSVATESSLASSPSSAELRRRRSTLAVVCVATAMLILDIAVVNTALSAIRADLHASLDGLKWVVDSYTLALAAAVLSAGSLADRFGRRRVFTLGLAGFTAASAGCALAPTIGLLNGARAVQGVAAALMFACSLALLAQAFPAGPARRRALAAYGVTIGAALAVGPLVGGLLTQYVDWRAVFAINLPIGLLGLWLCRCVAESRSTHPRPVDVPGQVLSTGALFFLVLALVRAPEAGWTSRTTMISLAVAAIAAVAFVRVERRSAHPMVPVELFADRGFSAAQVCAFAISSSFFAVFLYTTLYLQLVLELSPVRTGLVYLPATVVMFLLAGATASLQSRLSAAVLVGGSLGTVAAGLLLWTAAGVGSPWWAVLPGSILCFGASGVFNPVMSSLVVSGRTDEHSALATGVNDAFRQAGVALGVAALGTLVPSEVIDPAAFVTGWHHALLLAAAVAGIGAAVGGVALRGRYAE